jgi:hypothetical protein
MLIHQLNTKKGSLRALSSTQTIGGTDARRLAIFERPFSGEIQGSPTPLFIHVKRLKIQRALRILQPKCDSLQNDDGPNQPVQHVLFH